MLRKEMILRKLLALTLVVFCGCTPPAEPRHPAKAYVGAWVVDGATFWSEERTKGSLRDFRLTLQQDGRFTALNWPPDWFYSRPSSVPQIMTGTWTALYYDGGNHVRLEFSPFGPYTGASEDILPTFRVGGTLLRVGSGQEIIYLRRAAEGTPETPSEGRENR